KRRPGSVPLRLRESSDLDSRTRCRSPAPESSQLRSHPCARQQHGKIDMSFYGVCQFVDHCLTARRVRRRTWIGTPRRSSHRSDLGQPETPEVIVLERPMPHGSPHVPLPAAIKEWLGITPNLYNPVVYLVRLDRMPAPGARRPSEHLAGAEIDL